MNFKSLLLEFEQIGYKVERINKDSAVIYNRGVDVNYSQFDNTVATMAVNSEFGFVCQSDMKEMHEATVIQGEPSENYDIYMGVFRGDDETVLKESNLPFKDI